MELLLESPPFGTLAPVCSGQAAEQSKHLLVAAVDELVIGLVVVAEQAAVAACLAIRILVPELLIGPSLARMLEVADVEPTCGDAPQGNRVGGKAGQHSRTALGGLIEQECAPAI